MPEVDPIRLLPLELQVASLFDRLGALASMVDVLKLATVALIKTHPDTAKCMREFEFLCAAKLAEVATSVDAHECEVLRIFIERLQGDIAKAHSR